MSELVTLNKNEQPTTTSLLIADKFGKRHDTVLRAIKKLDCSEQFTRRNYAVREYKSKRGKVPYFEITRDGFSFLAMGFTGKESAKWKELYIKQFNRMERQLRAIAIERESTDWNVARIDGKMQRRKFTDVIAPFQIYALNQGSKGTSVNAYSNFSRLVNKAAGVKPGERNMLTDDMLRRMAHLEGIIEIKVKGLMADGVYCKDIYSQCKTLMDNFVEMVPYTGEIYLPKSEQLQIEEKAA